MLRTRDLPKLSLNAMPVLLLNSPERIDAETSVAYVAPISASSMLATDKDYVLSRDIPFIGGGMVCFWNTGPVTTSQLERRLLALPRSMFKGLETVWQHADGFKVDGLLQLPIGRPILSSADERIEFQSGLTQAFEAVWQPAFNAIESDEPVRTARTLKILDWLDSLLVASPGTLPALGLAAKSNQPIDLSKLRVVSRKVLALGGFKGTKAVLEYHSDHLKISFIGKMRHANLQVLKRGKWSTIGTSKVRGGSVVIVVPQKDVQRLSKGNAQLIAKDGKQTATITVA